jgi:hypothetical protein
MIVYENVVIKNWDKCDNIEELGLNRNKPKELG